MNVINLKSIGSALLFFAISALMALNVSAEEVTVDSIEALQKSVSKAKPGDVVILTDGTYTKPCTLSGKGTREKPIVVRAQTVGGVDMKVGVSMKGEYATLQGFKFSGKGGVTINGRGCRLSRSHMTNVQSGQWVSVSDSSREVEIDHCLFEKKENNKTLSRGCQLIRIGVQNKGEQHHVHHNHFRNIPKGKTGNGFETIQLITRGNPFDPKKGDSKTVIEDNLFERCNGEAEIISVKSSGNVIRRNTFRACRGGLVLRHGHGNLAAENSFFGDGEKGSGGVRLQGADQIVVNNYFHGLGRSAVAMMDGTPDKLYVRVERAMVIHNTMVDCAHSLEVGLNHSKHPNGTTPSACVIAGNIFSHSDKDGLEAIRLVQGDQPEGWTWIDNVVQGKLGIPLCEGLGMENPKLTIAENGMALPTKSTPNSKLQLKDMKVLETDLFGNARKGDVTIGAVQYPMLKVEPLTERQVGPTAVDVQAGESK